MSFKTAFLSASEKSVNIRYSENAMTGSSGFQNFTNFAPGGMAEWSNAAVLKTVVRFRGPGVRIPLPPQNLSRVSQQRHLFYFKQIS